MRMGRRGSSRRLRGQRGLSAGRSAARAAARCGGRSWPAGRCRLNLDLRPRPARLGRDETCPISTGGGTTRVHLVREGGGVGWGGRSGPRAPQGAGAGARRADVRAGAAGADAVPLPRARRPALLRGVFRRHRRGSLRALPRADHGDSHHRNAAGPRSARPRAGPPPAPPPCGALELETLAPFPGDWFFCGACAELAPGVPQVRTVHGAARGALLPTRPQGRSFTLGHSFALGAV